MLGIIYQKFEAKKSTQQGIVEKMYKDYLALILTIIIFLSGCTSSNEQTPSNSTGQTPVEDVIPITMANMRGHEALYMVEHVYQELPPVPDAPILAKDVPE